MRVGVVFPQTEIGSDPGAVREYVQAAESLGYDHILVYDHVLGANTQYYKNWGGVYQMEHQFHEPFVLFGYLAALTHRIQLTTGILILGQRQTALVAKQAAEVDILTDGRLRLGVGIGWNKVEYEALGENFHDRGKRSEEQISLLRALWTQKSVNFEGKWHRITHAGINPMPVQQPIPIWFGGGAESVLERIGRIGDGWITTTRNVGLTDSFSSMVERLHGYAREAGRDPKEIGLEGAVVAGKDRTVEDWVNDFQQWASNGATHVTFNTMNSGFDSPVRHIDAIRTFKEALA